MKTNTFGWLLLIFQVLNIVLCVAFLFVPPHGLIDGILVVSAVVSAWVVSECIAILRGRYDE